MEPNTGGKNYVWYYVSISHIGMERKGVFMNTNITALNEYQSLI